MAFDTNKVLAALIKAPAGGMKMTDIARRLRVPTQHQHRLRKVVGGLVREGLLDKPTRQTYVLTDGARALVEEDSDSDRKPKERRKRKQKHSDAVSPMLTGQIRVHPAGYGFVERDDGAGSVFVPAKYRANALDGDKVTVYTWEGYKGTEGRVEEVLSRGRAKLTGLLRKLGRTMVVEPDDPRMSGDDAHVQVEDVGHARPGDCVLAEITRYPGEGHAGMAVRVVRVLGKPDDPRTEVAKITACADIPEDFPPEAIAQAQATAQDIRPEDFADRIDLRDRAFLTIDPETARDFDDAICLETGPYGHRVWIAVADVSHYVRPDDALDRESQIRGVSVYYPDRSIPMLPRELSSGICSLNPHVDRCAMVVRLDIDDTGTVRDRGYAAAVIQSHGRLDYPGVAAALNGDFRGRRASYRKWLPNLEAMDQLARKMRKRRMARGALQLDLPEPKVVLDDDDPLLVRDVVRAKGIEHVRKAYELVEEYMLAANEAVGEFFDSRGITTVWRVHPRPTEQRVADLQSVVESFGVRFEIESALTPMGMCKVLQKFRGKPAERALTFLALRSLTQATYTTENVGHFGLASEKYLHFTSPIRRYPDVLVHRLLKHYLHREGQASGGGGAWQPPETPQLEELSVAASGYERRAAAAEREVVDMYRTYLMRDRVGEEFDGRINAIASFGVFVELDEPFVEGLIKIDALGDDYYEYDKERMRLAGRKTGTAFELGDRVRVQIVDVSVQRRQIDLILLNAPSAKKRGPAKGDQRGRAQGRGKGKGKPPPKKGRKQQPERERGGRRRSKRR